MNTQFVVEKSRQLCAELLSDGTCNIRKAFILGQISSKEPSAYEILGFREEIISRANLVDLGLDKSIDVCGTGGDGKDSFNISTCSAFVTASVGIKVVKHGNSASSSSYGSSDILGALGVKLLADKDYLKKQLDTSNICFLHAPLFHPCLKTLALVRKELKVKTIFNMLGPLLNPTGVSHQVAGVSSAILFRNYQFVLKELGKKFSVLRSRDGYDEISLTDSFYIATNTTSKFYDINTLRIDGKVLRVDSRSISSKKSSEESKMLAESILKGEALDHYINVVAINSGAAISISAGVSLEDGFMLAKESIKKGKPFQVLERLRECQEVANVN